MRIESKSFDWGRAIKDLHTGKIGGDAGKLLVDVVAVFLIVLTLSGMYLWIVPTLRKRRSSAARSAAALAKQNHLVTTEGNHNTLHASPRLHARVMPSGTVQGSVSLSIARRA